MVSVIITAGGVGKRMGSQEPKQFLLLNGKPILMHTLEQFYDFDKQIEILLTLPENHIDNWKELCGKYNFTIPHTVIIGGKERFHSVKNALQRAKGDYIAIHDGVRPFVSEQVFYALIETVKAKFAVVPVVPILESIRKIAHGRNEAVNRAEYVVVQTPQIFERNLILQAYSREYSPLFTDDASVVEAMGENIHLIEGNKENIKITQPSDLEYAVLLSKQISC